jgi:hypothetical protein
MTNRRRRLIGPVQVDIGRRKLSAVQWASPALTGAIEVLNPLQGEQRAPIPASLGEAATTGRRLGKKPVDVAVSFPKVDVTGPGNAALSCPRLSGAGPAPARVERPDPADLRRPCKPEVRLLPRP